MDRLTIIKKRYRTNHKRRLRQQIRYEKDYLEALDMIKEETIQKKMKLLDQKHKSILDPYLETTLSIEEYLDLKATPKLNKIFHRYHLRVLRLKHLNQKNNNVVFDIDDINQAMIKEKSLLEASILESRFTSQDAQKTYTEKVSSLKKLAFEQEQLLRKKLDVQTQKKRNKFEKKLSIHESRLLNLMTQHPSKPILEDGVILDIQHLTMQFGGLKAVDDLSFQVKKGEIFGLIGPNGAGKTTVFNCITQFYTASSGNIYFENTYDEHVNLNDYSVHHVIHEGIARTFQNVELIYELSILDNLLVGAHALIHTNMLKHMFHTPDLARETYLLKQRATKILIDLGLYLYKDAYPIGLPYGILKKIELARVLMTNPKLIILDEPAAGLNDKETEELAKTIKTIRDQYQTTIFLVEHDMGLVMDICDRICAISFGKKIAIGTPRDIQQNKDVQQAYLGGDDLAHT